MGKKIRKHFKPIWNLVVNPPKEILRTQRASVPLNKGLTDRISFSVLRNAKKNIRKIENISYEIYINDKWEWVVRYDDHGGVGPLHRHIRVSFKDNMIIESTDGIRKYKNKNFQLTWVCNDIRRNYLIFRKKFLKKSGLDLY